MNKPTVNKGDRITLPATPGGAKVNPTMWPTGYRRSYGETSRFYLHAGSPVTVVHVDEARGEVLVRHLNSKSTVLLSIDDLTNPVLIGYSSDPYTCPICSCHFTIDEWFARHHGEDGEDDMHEDCCHRSGPCSEWDDES